MEGSPIILRLTVAGLANKNTRYPVEFEFQINVSGFVGDISRDRLMQGTHLLFICSSNLAGSPVFYLTPQLRASPRKAWGDLALPLLPVFLPAHSP